MDKKFVLLIVLIISIFTFSSSLFSPLLVHTHDGLVHLPRIAAFYKAMADGQFPVRWAGDLNYGYGMPLFIFIYHTPYLVASFFLLIGIGLVWSFKLSMLVSFLLSGIFMFLFADAFFKDRKRAFLVTLLYQFAPFHLIDTLIRGSFGEMYSYAFFPLILFAITKYSQTKKSIYFSLIALATGILVVSHNSISLLFFTAVVFFVFLFSPNKKVIVVSLVGLFWGLLLSAYYWIPALLEHKYTYGDLFMKDLYKAHFLPLWSLVVPNLFDTKALRFDNLALQFGLVQVAAVLLALWKFGKHKINQFDKKLIYYSFSLIFFSLFFMSTISLPVWDQVSFLRQFQFPWRFLSLVVFATALLGGFAVSFLKKSTLFLLASVFIVLTSLSYWFPKEGYDRVNEKYYWNFPLNTTYYGETDVIWSAGPAKKYPKSRIEIAEGKGSITNFSKTSNKHMFMINASTNLSVIDNTQYFPGWKVYVDDRSVPIEFQNQNHRGLITFSVPSGQHSIKVGFEETKLRFFADILSVVGFIALIISYWFRKKIL